MKKQSRGQTLNGYRLEGPFAHENLTVFLIAGAERAGVGAYVTLEEALAGKTITIHETGSVNQLELEYTGEVDLFICAGELVKGGRQDRALPFDLIIGKQSGRSPLPSFCVESARWGRRGAESAAQFSSSDHYLSSKKARLAAKLQRDQGAVWESVGEAVQHMSASMGAPVACQESPSSYKLALEHQALQKRVADHVEAIKRAPEDHGEAIGLAFAVNGEWVGFDVFGSRELFSKLWPKLLQAAATEALQGLWQGHEQKGEPKKVEAATLSKLLQALKKCPEKRENLNQRTVAVTRDAEQSALFETFDAAREGAMVHENLIAK